MKVVIETSGDEIHLKNITMEHIVWYRDRSGAAHVLRKIPSNKYGFVPLLYTLCVSRPIDWQYASSQSYQHSIKAAVRAGEDVRCECTIVGFLDALT